MKIESWLFKNEDAETIHEYMCCHLRGRLDKNALDALKIIISKFCARRSPYVSDIRLSWLVASHNAKKPLFRRAVFNQTKTEYGFLDPPEYPTWIEISWSRGFGTNRIIRAVNLRIKPLSASGG